MVKYDDLLYMKDITKVYGNGVLANQGVNFSVKEGEIHALMGENGAGKSTLMKILFGIEQADRGIIEYKGEEVIINSTNDAIKLGIGMVHQHFKLVPSLSVAENIVLGMEPKKGFFVDKEKAEEITDELSKKFNFGIDPRAKVEELSVGKKQKIEILKALYRNVELLILDEPTAVLTPQETIELFEQLNKLKENGITIIFISHKLNEIKQICQRITILRQGKCMGTYNTETLTTHDISRLMVGRDIILDVNKNKAQPKEVRLSVKNLSAINESGQQALKNISFGVRSGEILGVAGVEGSGQSEIVELITGMRNMTRDNGEIILCDESIEGLSVKAIRELGLSYIPEDRIKYGVASEVSIRENLISNIYDSKEINSTVFTNKNAINKIVEKGIQEYDIRCSNSLQKVGMLSGGNMQKVVVARELSNEPKVLIAEQPTRGVDVGAVESIHKKIIDVRDEGCAVLLISADLNEILELADSIIVMCQGAISAYFPDTDDLSEEELGYYMLGVKIQSDEEVGLVCFEKEC